MASTPSFSSKLIPQDSRLRFYGGYIYGSIYWVPVDPPPTNQPPETDSQAAVNHFSRLPDDLIARHVFDKMPDSETLCRCSLVSKHFASLVLDTQSVSLKIPSWRPVCVCHPARPPTLLSRLRKFTLNFLTAPFRLVWRRLTNPFFQPELEMKIPNAIKNKPPAIEKFLSKLPQVESLRIDLSFTGIDPGFGPLLRWKFDKNGFIFVSAKNRDDEYDVVENLTNRLGPAEAVGQLNLLIDHIMDGFWRVWLVVSILDDFPYLKRVLVTDCMGQGRVELGKDDIKDLGDEDEEEEDCWHLKVWRLGAVRLPVSGCVMRDVTVCMFKVDGMEDGEVAEGAFEEREYDELARVVVKSEMSYELKFTFTEEDGVLVVLVG